MQRLASEVFSRAFLTYNIQDSLIYGGERYIGLDDVMSPVSHAHRTVALRDGMDEGGAAVHVGGVE